jgi:hypothetical protein
MVLGQQWPGRVGRRRNTTQNEPRSPHQGAGLKPFPTPNTNTNTNTNQHTKPQRQPRVAIPPNNQLLVEESLPQRMNELRIAGSKILQLRIGHVHRNSVGNERPIFPNMYGKGTGL